MELYHWPAQKKWGLPSIDVQSLHVLSYIKFAKAPVTLCPSLKSVISAKASELPSLFSSVDDRYSTPEDMFKYLNLKYYNPDVWMDGDLKWKLRPMFTLIEDKILLALLAAVWLDTQNFTEVTRCAYATACRYPLNFTTPERMRARMEAFVLESLNLCEEEEADSICKKLNGEAISTMNLLSEFLSGKEYLFGAKPSSVDALLFSCLAPILKMPLPNCKLHNHLKGCQNLCEYVDNILDVHFKELKTTGSSKSEDADAETSDWILPVAIATVAMFSYAVHIGLISKTR